MTQAEKDVKFILENAKKFNSKEVLRNFLNDEIERMKQKYAENPSDSAKVEN